MLERGAGSFFSFRQKKWKIRAYESSSLEFAAGNVSAPHDSHRDVSSSPNTGHDGAAFVLCKKEGVFLKITAPLGKGRKVSLASVQEKFRARGLALPPADTLKVLIKNATNSYVHVSSFERIPAHDAMLSVEIRENDMKAFVTATPPGRNGADICADTILSFLRSNRVVYGIDMERVNSFQDCPVYHEPYLVARGTPPKDGENARISYHFETDRTRVHLQELKTGKINFKELNLIHNVVKGQPLAQKLPAQRGTPGKTVTGTYLPAQSGKDVSIPLGRNTALARDGLTVIAETDGQALLSRRGINVEPIYVVEGNVSVKTGNIMFLGTVLVHGNVEDNYEIKASGNIEVRGTVGKALLDAEGDILVGQGIVGKEEGCVRAGKSLWAKFIQNCASVEAGDLVIVSDGIMNSHVIANRKIICRGRRADIIGSNVAAAEAVYARNLGSQSGGNDTQISVGFDPHRVRRLSMLQEELHAHERKLSDLSLNLQSLENLKRARKELPPDKEALETSLHEEKISLEQLVQQSRAELEEIQASLDASPIEGKISASGQVYSGVKVTIRDVSEEVRADSTAISFYLRNGLIRYGQYTGEQDEDYKRAPSGYAY